MSHWRIRFSVSTELSEPLSDLLTELGAIAVTLENAGADAFYEAAYPHRPSWSRVNVSGLFPQHTDTDSIEYRVRSSFGETVRGEVSSIADEDWERTWLTGYEPIRVGPRLWVTPSWLTPPVADAVNLVIDPGMAFGTGTHPTTAMCLDWLDRNRPLGKRVVDFGCGSGILAVAALKLGASEAWGVDIDPRALNASEHNAERNEVGEKYTACTETELPARLVVELVVANILARVLVDLRQRLSDLVCSGGAVLLTGILREQELDVCNAFQPLFEFSPMRREEWSMLIGIKR